MTRRNLSLLPFTRALRADGFQRIYAMDRNPLAYRLMLGNMALDVQLWRNGRHRVSRGRLEAGLLHEFTLPIDFTTPAGMLAAIRSEMAAGWVRTRTASLSPAHISIVEACA